MTVPEADDSPYDRWVREHDTLSDEDRRLIRAHIAALPWRPLISIVMPAYETRATLLRQAIASVQAQLYPFWELCVADDASPSPHVAAVLAEAAADDPRIRWVRRTENGHISAATNSALALATGPFVALMDHDDLLPEHALYEVALELGHHPDADVIYSDEDRIDLNGRRSDPYFKPGWNPELLAGHNMISHLGVFRTSLLEAIGGLRLGLEGSQDWDLALRATAATTPDRICHIPAVLYHWRWDPAAPSFSQSWLDRCQSAGRRAVQDWLDNEGLAGARLLQARLVPGWTHVVYPLPSPVPLLSVVLPARAGAAIRALLAATDWPRDRIELLVVGDAAIPDLPPGARLLRSRSATPTQMLNQGAKAAAGELLLLLGEDLQPLEQWWLREMAGQAMRQEVGLVGAKLVDVEGRVQHAGVVCDHGAAAVLGQVWWNDAGYFGQYALARAVSAVAGGCLVLRRSVFEETGGFDAGLDGPAAELALCQRVRDLGYRVVWTPEAVLRTGKVLADVLVDAAESGRDPYHNPNIQLGPSSQAVPASPRRVPPWRQAVADLSHSAI